MNLDHIGKYRVVGTIGKGAMGEVYKAKDPLLNRYVAVKTIAPALAADPDFRRRFQREAQSAAQLSHTNIVTVFDFGEENGLTYMAMELLEGRDLKDVVRSRDLRLADKIAVMEQILDGLAFAHEKGVVHRDLKPGNIHLQPSGQVKILDFGLARLGASDMTRTGTVMGTPHYMSPEQVRGQKADARSDVFSLGAVFYELLSSHRPFEADSVHGILFQILEQEPEPIRKWAPEVPGALVRVVERALAKDPARRFAHAGEMARALAEARDAIGGETVVGTGPGADATVLPSDPTLLDPAAAVHGATALSLARTPAPAAPGRAPRTERPEPTVGGGPATHVPSGDTRSRALLLGGAVLLLAAAAGGALWLRGRAAAPAGSPAAPALESSLADVYVANQVELARADLASRDYEAATRRAQEILKVAPANAEARGVLDQAREAQRQIAEAEAEARAAAGRKDVPGASLALGRLMALAPQHPAIGEVSAALERLGSREPVRAAAGRAPATATAPPAVQATPPSPSPTVAAAPTPAPPPTAAPAPPVAPTAVTAAPPLPATVPVRPTPSAPTPVPTPPRSAEAEVRRVIAEYGRAIESRDLALYRAVKPDLSAEDERRLREAFKVARTQRVGITVDSVRVDGDRATVRATRQDVIDGRTTKAVAQVFRLVRVGASWRIE